MWRWQSQLLSLRRICSRFNRPVFSHLIRAFCILLLVMSLSLQMNTWLLNEMRKSHTKPNTLEKILFRKTLPVGLMPVCWIDVIDILIELRALHFTQHFLLISKHNYNSMTFWKCSKRLLFRSNASRDQVCRTVFGFST